MIVCAVSGSRCIRRGKPEECYIEAPDENTVGLDEDQSTAESPIALAEDSHPELGQDMSGSLYLEALYCGHINPDILSGGYLDFGVE
jgi:hypothetical protein